MSPAGKSGLLGEVREVDGVWAVHVEDVYDTDIEDLWEALTEPVRLGRWIAEVKGDMQLGGLFTASFTSGWNGSGRVEVCEAPRRLLLTMDPGTTDEGQIEATLATESEGTRLVIEDRGLPAREAPDHAAGWQVHLEDLRATLEGRKPGPWHARWTALKPDYRPEGGQRCISRIEPRSQTVRTPHHD